MKNSKEEISKKLTDEKLEEMERELDISKEDILALAEIYLDKERKPEVKEIEEKLREIKLTKSKKIEKEKGEKLENKKDKEEQKQNEKVELSKEEVKKIPIESEIKINTKATDAKTIGQILGIDGKGYKSIGVVKSDKLREPGNNNEVAIVGVKQDGSVEKIDSLEAVYGSNPSRKINSMDRHGNITKKMQPKAIFKIKGSNETQIAVEKGAMGRKETHLVRTPSQNNKESISIPLENQNTRVVSRDARELMNEHKNPRMKEELDRLKIHEEANCNEINVKNINDNEYDDTHKHGAITDQELDELAKEILENDKIAEIYNTEDVKNKLRANIENGEGLDKEQLKESVEEQLEESAELEHNPYNRKRR